MTTKRACALIEGSKPDAAGRLEGAFEVTSEHFVPGPRRGWLRRLAGIPAAEREPIEPAVLAALDELNLLQRTLVASLYNCVPASGHPGGSISASRIVEGLLYAGLDCDLAEPERPDADLLVFAAGHKALGLYAAWALRTELARILRPELLPADERYQLRLEDLLGFRRNPIDRAPLLDRLRSKSLDGHPTPATPFVPLATGASGVGLPAAFGLAWALLDLYPDDPPQVHVLEGEGGLTPGRVAEAMAAAASANLHNVVLHVDWNQASIDSGQVCREGARPGDYVQWDPLELAHFHDFNALLVEDGLDHAALLAGQAWVRRHAGDNRQPSCIVYRTVKGWRYGIEGRASHGAGHPCCSQAFYDSLGEFERHTGQRFERLCPEPGPEALLAHQWSLLGAIRQRLESSRAVFEPLAEALVQARARLDRRGRNPRPDAPDPSPLLGSGGLRADEPPPGWLRPPGRPASLRDSLADALAEFNRISAGAVVVASADLAASTSVTRAVADFPGGFYNSVTNPRSRLLATGGICEDAMGAMLMAIGTRGRHLGVGSSYGAFIAAMQHVPARLHAISQQARREAFGLEPAPYLMICAHAGLLTGEDGPTHADPQCLQLLQDNFPPGALISLTPWDPNELWACLVAGLQARPALLAVFVPRPPLPVLDRAALGLPPPEAAAGGLVALRAATPGRRPAHGCVVLQGCGVVHTFLSEVLPQIERAGLDLAVYCVTSAELFERLDPAERERLYPEACARVALGITEFTLPTLGRWITSPAGRRASLHAFVRGGYPGSGQANKVLEQAGLGGLDQWYAVRNWAERISTHTGGCP